MEQEEILILFSFFYFCTNHPYYTLIHVIFEFLFPVFFELQMTSLGHTHHHRDHS